MGQQNTVYSMYKTSIGVHSIMYLMHLIMHICTWEVCIQLQDMVDICEIPSLIFINKIFFDSIGKKSHSVIIMYKLSFGESIIPFQSTTCMCKSRHEKLRIQEVMNVFAFWLS